MAIKTLVITAPTGATGGATGSYIAVPLDFGSLISIEAIGGGGGGTSGGATGSGFGGGGAVYEQRKNFGFRGRCFVG